MTSSEYPLPDVVAAVYLTKQQDAGFAATAGGIPAFKINRAREW
ncbi:MAG TPA: hypothetical protein VNW28_08585 [Chthoniobacterales bacterium]|nr:hypothetical protein [Chthoniobacterales bacterium]